MIRSGQLTNGSYISASHFTTLDMTAAKVVVPDSTGTNPAVGKKLMNWSAGMLPK